jgi:outer membrane receptor protein involved in Fe transport
MNAARWPALCLALMMGTAAVAQQAAAVSMTLRAGDRLEAVLAALNERGHRIVYSSALVRPDMTLRATPTSGDIDSLLREILSPWNLRAVRAGNGDWLIAAAEDAVPRSQSMPGVSSETIEVIDITASRLRLAVAGASRTFLDRQDVERMPHLADDPMRMLKVLPGVSGGDFSAALNIRGGRREEALLTIDGAEIHNAFHFRDIDGAMSVLDTNLIEGIDFINGGMTADIGDYMSGVVGMQTRRPSPADDYSSGVGISFVSAYGRSSGNFADDRGWWMASARRGFLDVLTEQLVADDERLTPRYTDAFLATGFDFNERTSLAARYLLSDDDLKFLDENGDEEFDSAGKGHSQHLWLTLDHAFADALRVTTLLSSATVGQTRESAGFDEHRAGAVHADNEFQFLDLRQAWSWSLNDTHLARWGFNFGRQRGEYDYALDSVVFDPLIAPVPIRKSYATNMDVDLRKLGAYAAWRMRLGDRTTAEAGVRWDRYRYDDGLEFDATSPRLNIVHVFGDDSELRAAWGVNHQPQAVNELQVEDDVTQFFAPERAQQWVVGYTRHFVAGISARIDLYDKAYDHLRPRFENALDPVQLIPEGASDRIRIEAVEARARGIELTVRREAERGLSGWISLAVARAEDHDDGDWRPRTWEQRETLSFGGSWTGAKWNLSLAGLFHSGTPTTALGIESTPLPGGGYEVQGIVGARNGARLGSYSRIDLRANRDVLLASSKLSFYLEVTNLLDSRNQCCVGDYRVVAGRPEPVLVLEKGYWLPILPSFGVQWEF